MYHLPPSSPYRLDRLERAPEELAALTYVLIQAHVGALAHTSTPRWTFSASDQPLLAKKWEMMVGGGVFTWPLAVIWKGPDHTSTDLSVCGGAEVVAQNLQVEPTEMFCLPSETRQAPGAAEAMATVDQLVGWLSAGTAWGEQCAMGREFADAGGAATRFTSALRQEACDLRDRMTWPGTGHQKLHELEDIMANLLRRAPCGMTCSSGMPRVSCGCVFSTPATPATRNACISTSPRRYCAKPRSKYTLSSAQPF